MLRGASKTIIEIAEPESRYFEKVILFIKPEYAAVPDCTLKPEAKSLINDYGKANFKRKKRSRNYQNTVGFKIGFAAFCILLAATLIILGVLKIF